MPWYLRSAAGAAVLLLSATVSQAEDPAAERGRGLVRDNCSRCHAVGPAGASPLAKAPPFRVLHHRYPVENLAEAFAEGIRTGHPAMPEFEFESDQIDDLIAYLKSLER